MTPCERARAGLMDRIDGLLKPHEFASLETHLAHCAACRAELARHEALVAALEALPEAPASDVPRDFVRGVMAELPEMLPKAEGPGHVLRWGILVAALLSGVIAAFAMLVSAGGPETARQALQPLGASFQLGGILLAQGATGLAVGLSALSEAFAATGISAPLLIVLFAAANAALLVMLARLRPQDGGG